MEIKKDKVINVSKTEPLKEGCFRVADKADPKCTKCYGTGLCGENVTRGTVIICKCVEDAVRAEDNENK